MKILRILGVLMIVSFAFSTLVTQAQATNISPAVNESTPVLLKAAADELLYTAKSVHGGFAWQSQIQSPNFNTDRDVGTSSVGMGLLSAYQMTHDKRFLNEAEGAGNWLLAVAQHANGGLMWPDYANSATDISTNHYTSFDDGAPGIADFLYQLGVASNQSKYITAAQAGMTWEMHAGMGVNGTCPSVMCRWSWSVGNSNGDGSDTAHFTGMGQGAAGIAYAFDVFAQRFPNNPAYKQYANATARYVESRMLGKSAGINQYAIPETNGTFDSSNSDENADTTLDTGYLSGSAGDAFMFLKLYKDLHVTRYLTDAEHLLSWESRVAIQVRNSKGVNAGFTWPISFDYADSSNANTSNATGVEEGDAGIGWVYLQAYKVTGMSAYRTMAAQAGNWLLHTAMKTSGGLAWLEDADDASSIVHTSLDNGAPGIGIFLYDLHIYVPNSVYSNAAQGVVNWLKAKARVTHYGTYWIDQNTDDNNNRFTYLNDPSWHWGSAGIINFLARITGSSTDIPGEQPAL